MGPSGKALRLEKTVSHVVKHGNTPDMPVDENQPTPHGWLGSDEGASNVIPPTTPTLYANTSGKEFHLVVANSPAPPQEEAHGVAATVSSVSWPSCQYSQSNAPLASMAVTHYEEYNGYSYQPIYNNNYGAYQQARNDSYSYNAYNQQALNQPSYYSPGCQQGQDVPQYQQQGPEQNDDHDQRQPSVTQQPDTPVPEDEEVRCLTRGLKFPSAAPGCPPGVPCVAIRKQSDEESLEPVGTNVASLDEALVRSTNSVVEGMKEYYKIARDNTIDHVINDPDKLAVPIRLACLTKVLVDVIARYTRHVIANPAIQEAHRPATPKLKIAGKTERLAVTEKIAGRAERLAITEYTAYKREFDKVS